MARPVYIDNLLRSIPKASVRALHADRGILAAMICMDPACCPDGRRDLLNDTRTHAISPRLASLRALANPAQPAWRWNHLATATRTGLGLAQRINTFAANSADVSRIDLAALQARLSVADHRWQTIRRNAAA